MTNTMLNISGRKLPIVISQTSIVVVIILLLVHVLTTKTSSTIRLEVKVLGMDCSKCYCVYDTLTIEINYGGSKPIKPGFIIVTGEEGVNKMWKIVKGPSVLKPGSSAIYVIEAPFCSCAIRPNKHYRIIVVDIVDGVILGASPLYHAPNLGH